MESYRVQSAQPELRFTMIGAHGQEINLLKCATQLQAAEVVRCLAKRALWKIDVYRRVRKKN